MNLSKGNFGAIKPLCLKLGAFPEGDKFLSIIKNLTKYKAFLIEPDMMAQKLLEDVKDKAKEKIEEGQQAVMSKAMRTIGHDPEKLFNIIDKDQDGYICLTEFAEVSKHMGLHISQENMVRIFAMVDKRRKRKLGLSEFSQALIRLRLVVAQEALLKSGFSKEELMVWLILSIIFLIGLFVFIFIGINAFSYANSFGAVVNSLLPASAGGAIA
jgi:Ca2+-binding EF-hand superfamily protein